MLVVMNSSQLKRWLRKQGCSFESGHGGHLIVRRGQQDVDPSDVWKQEGTPTGLVEGIKKNLGLE